MQRASDKQNKFLKVVEHARPAVRKPWLFLLAGLVWTGVGIMLNHYAYDWLHLLPIKEAIPMAGAGIVLAALIYRFGFSRLAIKNIHRIKQLPREKICIFAFQRWSSYPLVIFMISLGIFLRKHSGLPKPLLAGMYIGIGGGLFCAGLHYIVETFAKRTT